MIVAVCGRVFEDVTPVTTPVDELIVAHVPELIDHDPPASPLLVNVVGVLLQSILGPIAITPALGRGLTVIG